MELTQQQINSELSKASNEQLTTEILVYKRQTAQGIIEIGKRLIEMKSRLQHGEWLEWLENEVEFSERTARNFIRIAKEIPKRQTFADLETSKIYTLLSVPAEEREEFIQEKHEINGEVKTVDDMTTRELQKVIKEKKELEQAKKQLESEKQSLFQELQIEKSKPQPEPEIRIQYQDRPEVIQSLNNYKQIVQTHKREGNRLNSKIQDLEKELSKLKEIEGKKAEIDRIHSEIEDLQLKKNEIYQGFEELKKINSFANELEKILQEKILPFQLVNVPPFDKDDEDGVKQRLVRITKTMKNFYQHLNHTFNLGV